MRKTIRVVRNIIYAVAGLVACLFLFLLSYYQWNLSLIHKQEADIENQLPSRVIEADSLILNPTGRTLNLLPVPKTYSFSEGTFKMPSQLEYFCTDSISAFLAQFDHLLPDFKPVSSGKKAQVLFLINPELPEQGYQLTIEQDKISVGFSRPAGLYYALVSLKVLNRNYAGYIPCVTIDDYPDLPVRGLILDISGGKVPTLQTLMQIIDIISDLKYNHFEVYADGYSFAYPSFTDLWQEKETPLTGNEIQILDSICKSRFIELVPCQNSFGHMSAWLATEAWGNLAECPDGYKYLGLFPMKETLDPSDRGSIDLVTRMTDDLLLYFSSDKFNANMNVQAELGLGKSKNLIRKRGIGPVFLDYTMKVHDLLKARERKMMMEANIILRTPELLKLVPEDIILLDYGCLPDYPFERNCKILKAHNRNYMVCAVTGNSSSIGGLTDNMKANIASAASNAYKYNASGLLLKDMGDFANWQYLPVGFAAYATAASYSWNTYSIGEIPLVDFLNGYIFGDTRGIMGNLVLDLGRYQGYEEMTLPNMTSTMVSLQFGLQDKIVINEMYKILTGSLVNLIGEDTPELLSRYKRRLDKRRAFDFTGITTFIEEKQSLLQNTDLHAKDSVLVRDEFLNTVKLIKTGVSLEFYNENKEHLKNRERKEELRELQQLLQQYLTENQRLWKLRNKVGGYERSIKPLKELSKQIAAELSWLEKPFYARSYYHIREKIKAAIHLLQLKYES